MTASAERGYFAPLIPRPGEVFGPDARFEVHDQIGAGGAGEVLLVWDRLLGRKVAAKFMREIDGRSAADDAAAEARATARLKHDNVVTVYDLGSYGGAPYLLMEYLEGESLNLMVGGPTMTALRAVEILADVARGLEHAHAQGVLHLDLKPSNVFVERSGRAKILDFGVGSLPRGGTSPTDYDPGPVVGTPLYMAPEQWGLARVDARTDVWAAGMVLYELLTGSSPGPESAPSFRLRPHHRCSVPPIAERLGLRAEVDLVLSRCLANDPAGRFQAAWELRAALERLKSFMPASGQSGVHRSKAHVSS